MAKASHGKDIDEIIKFWEDPNNFDLISKAVPLESLTFEQLVRDHVDQKKEWTLSSSASAMASKIWKILKGDCAKPEYDVDKSAVEATKPFKEESFESATPESSQQQIKSQSRVVKPTCTSLSEANINDFLTPKFFKVVDSDNIDQDPYKCVGKLLFVRPDSHEVLPYYSTAFYVGNKKIITAAHAFDTDSRKCLSDDGVPLTDERIAIFVPGMFLEYDYKGNRFGYYCVENIKKLDGYLGAENYSCNDVQYDICSAEISRGRCDIRYQRIKYKYGKDKDGDTSSSESENEEDIYDINFPDYYRKIYNMIDADIDDKLGHSCIILSSRHPWVRHSPLEQLDKIIGYGYCPPNFDGRIV